MAWIKSRYPETLCTTDLAGNKRTAPHGGQAICPTKPPQGLARHYDISNPAHLTALLMIEFKATGADIIKKDGTLRQTQHLKEQSKLHSALSKRGYCVGFVVGLENGKRAVEAYLNADFNNTRNLYT